MAQNITLLGASYTDVPAVELPKTGGGTATFTDTTPTTASASDVSQGKYFFTASGVLTLGTGTGGGSVTQDQDGFIILPPDGGGSPSVGGLVYETGTWTPSADVASYVIPFVNTHTEAPFYYIIADQTGSYSSTTASNYSVSYYNFHQFFGAPFYTDGANAYVYGLVTVFYRNTNATALQGSSPTSLTQPYTYTGSSTNGYSRYWATESGIKAYTNSTNRYWRAGRTYKWIAVWKPTT